MSMPYTVSRSDASLGQASILRPACHSQDGDGGPSDVPNAQEGLIACVRVHGADAAQHQFLIVILMLTSIHLSTVLVQFVSEASATLKRRAAGTAEDVWLKSNLYPDYYLNTFHFQVRSCMTQD